MKRISLLHLAVLCAAAAAVGAEPASQNDFSRAQKGEIYGFGQCLVGWETTTFYNGYVALKFDTGFGGGVGFGFNFNNHLNLNTEFAVAAMDVKAGSVTGNTTAVQWTANLDYNILRHRFTPLVTAGGGVMTFTGDFGSSSSEFSETDFQWGVGAGVRWDISTHLLLKAVYRVNWTSMEDSDSPTLFHSVAIGVGYRF